VKRVGRGFRRKDWAYVSPEAWRLAESGVRLTPSHGSPREFDLPIDT